VSMYWSAHINGVRLKDTVAMYARLNKRVCQQRNALSITQGQYRKGGGMKEWWWVAHQI